MEPRHFPSLQGMRDPLFLLGKRIPQRVVSLVPSYTESLFDLGFGETVVGVSDYCTRPPEKVKTLSKVGGPKSLRVDEILRLQPDLVIANQEENSPEAIEALVAEGTAVWLTFPLTVQESLADLYTLARLYRSEPAMLRVHTIERSLEWARLSALDKPPLRCFCPIWQDHLETGEGWWMTFNAYTYPSDLLHCLNVENVFANRNRRYPLLAELNLAPEQDPVGRDTRYPRVSRSEVLESQPDVILLPDEPFAYTEQHVDQFRKWFANTPAVKNNQIYLIDGSLLFWYGTRLAQAITDLPTYFQLSLK